MPISSAQQTYKGPVWGFSINKNGYPKRKNLKAQYNKSAALTLTSLSDKENSDKSGKWKKW